MSQGTETESQFNDMESQPLSLIQDLEEEEETGDTDGDVAALLRRVNRNQPLVRRSDSAPSPTTSWQQHPCSSTLDTPNVSRQQRPASAPLPASNPGQLMVHQFQAPSPLHVSIQSPSQSPGVQGASPGNKRKKSTPAEHAVSILQTLVDQRNKPPSHAPNENELFFRMLAIKMDKLAYRKQNQLRMEFYSKVCEAELESDTDE